jgi:hypothetical protein
VEILVEEHLFPLRRRQGLDRLERRVEQHAVAAPPLGEI